MSRRFTPKIVTANGLREGDVVYLTADDRWSPLHHEAELIEDEAHAQMRLLHAAAQKLIVVGAYLADAKAGPERPGAHPFPRGVPHPRPVELLPRQASRSGQLRRRMYYYSEFDEAFVRARVAQFTRPGRAPP